jgi:hypothetical protein
MDKVRKGSEIQVRFRGEMLTWLPMNEVRQSDPIELLNTLCSAALPTSQHSHGVFPTHYDVTGAWFQR